MSYSVELVRFTLKCDACGLIEKRDLDEDSSKGTVGWCEVRVCHNESYFCLEKVTTILGKRGGS
jgi:hypothetical protein